MGLMHGSGSSVCFDGTLYDGDFRNDAMDGWGRIEYPENNLVYEGDFKEGERHGQGVLRRKEDEGAGVGGVGGGGGEEEEEDDGPLILPQIPPTPAAMEATTVESLVESFRHCSYHGGWEHDRPSGFGVISMSSSGEAYYCGKFAGGLFI